MEQPNTRMVRLIVMLPPALKQELEQAVLTTRRTQSDLVREGIKKELARCKAKHT